MNVTHLSKRLAAVAKWVPSGSRILDVGTDHAYLPANLAYRHVIKSGVASEVAPGPLANAVKEIKATGLERILSPRLANGLLAMRARDRINVITICGMGGSLIRDILNRGRIKLVRHPELILQPNVKTSAVRKWLANHHYRITHEDVVYDHQRFYEIVVAQFTNRPIRYDKWQLRFGPRLLRTRPRSFLAKWRQQAQYLRKLIKQIKQARVRPRNRIAQLEQQLAMIRKVLKNEG